MNTLSNPNQPSPTPTYRSQVQALAYEAMRRRAERGLPNNRPPLGYRIVKDTQGDSIVVDEAAAKFVREAFKLVAAGYSLRKPLKELTRSGMRSPGGKEMGAAALSRILHNEFYVGYVWFKGKTLPGGHTPIVERQTFDAARRQLAKHKSGKSAHLIANPSIWPESVPPRNPISPDEATSLGCSRCT